MARISFWQLLLGDHIEPWEAKRMAVPLEDAPERALSPLGALVDRIDAQAREIVMLRTAMTVLTRSLVEGRVLDPHQLDAKFEAAMDAASTPPPQSTVANVRDRPPPELADTFYSCIKCRQRVPAASTSMTADGPRCDRCPDPTTPYR